MVNRFRQHMTATRRAGIALTGALGVVTAVASGTALAAPSPSAAMQMPGMSSASHVGNTSGWYHGHTVKFHYTRNFYCRMPPASMASTKCEVGANYTQTPANTFDPLYVIVPLGFTPPKGTLQCPTAGRCIDHPHTVDLSAVLGSGTGNAMLPPHSHIVTTANSGQAEWWNVYVVGVKSLHAWNAIVRAKTGWELRYLQRTDSKEVTGNLGTNLFLYFSVRAH